jgi:hypothetical protein
MGGGKGGTTTSSVAIPPEVLARYNSVNARAETAAGGQFQPYTGQFVAGMTPTQQAGVQGTNAAANLAQPFYQAGTGLTMQGAQSVGPLTQGQIGYYQDPFTQSVVNPTLGALRQDQGQQRSMQQAQQIKSGAFGGDRAGLERANLARQQNLGTAQAIAPLYSQGYQTGVQTAMGQQGVISSDLQRKLAAGQQVAGLGTGAQGAALQGAQQQLAAGTAEQQTQQADLTAQYQQFLQQQGFPYQQAQFLANIAMGTGALSGSTTTTQQPSGFFSDRRLKHDVHEIGKTHDGQPIYSYKYNGDNKTQIGLMAQDVEKHHPEAVGVMGGYKTVDYGKATEDSERPERAAGGGIPNSMGGGVWHPDAYAGGGLVDGDDMKAILQAQQAGFGPWSGGPGGGVYGGSGAGVPGGKMQGVVPQASLPVPKLVTAGSPPARQASGMTQAASTGANIASTGRAAIDFKNWVSGLGKDKPGATPERTQNGAATAPVAPTSKDIPVSETGKAISVPGAKPDPTAFKGPTRLGNAGNLGSGTQLASADMPSFGADDFSFAAARGGVIPFRHHRAGGGVNPYELSDDMSYIPKSVLKEGEEEADQAAGQFKKNTGQGGGGGSQGGGLGSALGTANSAMSLGKGMSSLFGGGGTFAEGMGPFMSEMGSSAAEAAPTFLSIFGLKDGGVVPRHGYALDGAVDPTSDQPVYDPRADMPSENAVEAAYKPDEKLVTPVKEVSNPVDEAQAIIDRAREVHAQKESGGKYDILGPVIPRGAYAGQRPVGRYQVMEGNIGPWTKTALGKEMTPEEFRRDNDAQDTVFNKIWGDNYRKFGNVPDAVSMWASGRPAAEGAKTRDIVFGTSTGAYIDDATRKILGKDFKPAEPGVSRESPIGRGSTLGDVFKSITPDSIPTNENFWIPALSGVGSMLASNRPTFLGALGEGLVGGVGGYQTMQKQHAEMAKGVLDLVKTRFTRTQDDNGNTIFYDTTLGRRVSPEQVQGTISGMFENLGLNPKAYGYSAAPQAPSAPTAPGTAPAVVDQSKPSAKDQPKQPPANASDAEKVSTTPAININEMNYGQLDSHARQNPSEWGLDKGPNNILDLQAQEAALRKRAAMLRVGDPEQAPQATAALQEAEKIHDRIDKYVERAISDQALKNKAFAESSSKAVNDRRDDISKRAVHLDAAQSDLKLLANTLSNFETGRSAELQGNIGGWLNDTGLIRLLPADTAERLKNAPGSVDLVAKEAMQAAMQDLVDKHMIRAPVGGVKAIIQKLPNINTDPSAAYALVARMMGEVRQNQNMDLAYSKEKFGTDPRTWEQKWLENKENKLDYHVNQAFKELPRNPNISRNKIEELERTWGPFASESKTSEPLGKPASAPAAPAGPKAGVVQDGFRFKGGNPADQNNWEKVQ